MRQQSLTGVGLAVGNYPDWLVIKDSPDKSVISSGIAITDQDRWYRNKIVTDRYILEKYITKDDPGLIEGIYNDLWESASVPVIAKKNSEVLNSLRIVINTPQLNLPINKRHNRKREIKIDPNYMRVVENAPLEITQFAKPHQFNDFRGAFAVIRATIVYMEYVGKDYAVATIDKRVLEYVLNGSYMNLGFPIIGEPAYYMGSYSIPVLIRPRDMIRNCAKVNPGLAEFFEKGKKASKNYNWYNGA